MANNEPQRSNMNPARPAPPAAAQATIIPDDPLDAAASSTWIQEMQVTDYNENESGDPILDKMPTQVEGKAVCYYALKRDEASQHPLCNYMRAVKMEDFPSVPKHIFAGSDKDAFMETGMQKGCLYRDRDTQFFWCFRRVAERFKKKQHGIFDSLIGSLSRDGLVEKSRDPRTSDTGVRLRSAKLSEKTVND